MSKSVSDVHKQLYHYTNAGGLHGIISAGAMWATQIGFLNDAYEHQMFLKYRVPPLLESTVRSALTSLMAKSDFRTAVERQGGFDVAVHAQLTTLTDAIQQATREFDDPYICSFCGLNGPDEAEVARDGLLSQWRGYGTDGGYAVVFRTDDLEDLLRDEAKRFNYQAVQMGDVHYYDDVTEKCSDLEEIRDAESVIKRCAYEFMVQENPDAFEDAYPSVSYLACIYKHWGFHEEREVRIIMIRSNPRVTDEAKSMGEKVQPDKPVFFRQREGLLVPTIQLFDTLKTELTKPLPIDRVIVGPHPDKWLRKKSVEILLAQRGISAEVVVSGIPYLGR